MNNLNSKHYNANEIEEDHRFIQARKEALFTQIFLLIMTVIFFIVVYLTGTEDPFQSSFYIAGWPAWFVYGCIVVLVEFAVCIFFCLKIFDCSSLDATDDPVDKEKQNE